MNQYYIYTHTRIGDDLPFYVGKGTGKRAYSLKSRSEFWRRIAKNGYTVEFEFENLSEEDAFQMEKDMILMYGRRNLGTGCLVNLTDGGEGSSGLIPSDETRKKMSEAQKGNINAKGKIHSEEIKHKNSEARKGKTPSDETKRKLSEALKGRVFSDEHKQKLSNSRKGQPNFFTGKTHSEETKKKISEAAKERHARRKQNQPNIY